MTYKKALEPSSPSKSKNSLCCQSDPRQNFFSDLGRMAGVNEVIGVYLMAKKLNIPVCPHAG